jgi:glycosyltransferase involved in cell wall biosynthesis
MIAMRKKRIVHVTTYVHPDKFGGAERVVHGIARAQAALGHEVVVLTGNHDEKVPRETIDGFELVRYPLPRGARGVRFFASVARGAGRALRDLGREIDVIHAHQPASAYGTLGRGPRRGGPVRIWSFYAPWAAERAVETTDGTRRGPLAALRHFLLQGFAANLDQRLLRRAEGIVVLSEFSLGQIASLAPGETHGVEIIPPGVDERFSPAVASRAAAQAALGLEGLVAQRPLLVSVRRLVKRMGLDDLIQAVGLLRDEGIDVALAIVGEGPQHAALDELARAIGVADRVRLLGRVAEAELPLAYRAADLFVLPTRALEGFGMATAEALASGVPVLATDVGATPELLARFTRRMRPVAPGPSPLASGIRGWLADREALATDALEAAAAIRATLTYEACASALDRLYDSRAAAPR